MIKDARLDKNQKICAAFRTDAQEGLDLLFETYYRLLVIRADTLIHDMEIAEDIVQDFFVDIWNSKIYTTFRHQTLSAYLYISVRNRCLKKIAKKEIFNHVTAFGDEELIWEEYNDQHDTIILKLLEEIDQLPERSREVMEAVFVKGMKYAEVADLYGISISTVKTLLHSSILKLRKQFDDHLLIDFFIFFSQLSHKE